jgi:hypothetical protein
MLRAAACVVVVTMAWGPALAELCRSWCHPDTAVVTCEHPVPAGGSIAAGDTCDPSTVAGAPFLNESAWRLGTPDQHVAVAPPGQQVRADAMPATRPAGSDASPPLATRPLSINLRI